MYCNTFVFCRMLSIVVMATDGVWQQFWDSKIQTGCSLSLFVGGLHSSPYGVEARDNCTFQFAGVMLHRSRLAAGLEFLPFGHTVQDCSPP